MTNPGGLPTITPLVIATRNRGKYREIVALLDGLPLAVVPLDGAGPIEVPPEGGDSFRANAVAKAAAVARATGWLALADDSGLEVDALGGAPGVFSARFAGAGVGDAERNAALLARLVGVPPERRGARFRCVVAIATPAGGIQVAEGVCEGRITTASRGVQGFGYDPIFEIPSLGRTLAELDGAAKNRVSHRGQALRGARDILAALTGDRRA